MDSSTTAPPVIDEEVWQAWVRKGKLAEKTTNRNLRIVAGVALVLFAISSAFYASSGK